MVVGVPARKLRVPLVLASASPRRLDLLASAGITPEVAPADVDESAQPGELPGPLARRLAAAKADAAHARHPDACVLAADTVVALGPEALGKAATPDEARAMLARLAGRPHEVITAFSLRLGAEARDRVVSTRVTFRALAERDLDWYVASGDWKGKAGAYAIQGGAAGFAEAVLGSYTGVVGLPLAEVVAELEALDVL